MKVKVPVIVKDPDVVEYKEINPTEEISIEEELFLDGPISPRVAILDFIPDSGALAKRVPFVPPENINGFGTYSLDKQILEGGSKVPPPAAAVSVFGAVYKALQMFEEKDALGRRVVWAFDAPQLLVVPRAGDWANAYYERDSHSLQFFRFPADDGRMIFTAHSQDIVAHETAHAVVDGVAPDLYDTISPQGLAIHEAVADLTSLLCSFRCRELASRILGQMNGSLNNSTAFSGLAGQFGAALDRGRPYLRDLFNSKSLRPDTPDQDRVRRNDPHELSEVLSGAFYSVLVKMYDELRRQYRTRKVADSELVAAPEAEHVQMKVAKQTSTDFVDRSGTQAKALFVASEKLKRTLFRGLDYLPPGDVTFADLARAVLASDEASHPESWRQRHWMVSEFIQRGIAPSKKALKVRTNFDHSAIGTLDLEALVQSDYVAYNFADDNRELLGIPDEVNFEVRPRLDVTKRYWHRGGPQEVRECFFKVAWTEIEENVKAPGLPALRRWISGTTLVMSWDDDPPKIRALLTTRRSKQDRTDTDDLLLHLLNNNLLKVGNTALGPGEIPLQGVVAGDIIEGALRIRGMGRTLHITQEHE